MASLLTVGNPKTAKGARRVARTGGLTMTTVAVATFDETGTIAVAFATATAPTKAEAVAAAITKVPAPVTIIDIIEHTDAS